jgi:hypothetical protein
MNAHTLERLRAGFREIVRTLDELVTSDDWIDQKGSPLGRRLHCEAARTGALRARKVGKTWLARRADIDAYIEAHGKKAPSDRPVTDEATAVAEILEFRAPRRKRGGGRAK